MKAKKYHKASLEWKRGSFFSVGLLFILAAVLVMFEYRAYDREVVESLGDLELNLIEEEVIPISQHIPPPPPPPPQVTTQIQIVADEVEIEEQLVIEEMEIDADSEVDFIVEEYSNEEPEEEFEEEEIFTIVEEMPEFPGGMKALFEYLGRELSYPPMAKDARIQGKVYVTFVVERDGSIADVRILRGIGGGCDEEAIKVVQSMPKWTPGKQRNKPVKVQYNLPINFILK
jgi:protein TonB